MIGAVVKGGESCATLFETPKSGQQASVHQDDVNKQQAVQTAPIEQIKETKWTLIWGGQRLTCYYDKNSINKIEENIWEVTRGSALPENVIITRKQRFNCKSKEYQVGESHGWKNDKEVTQMNFSGVWFPVQTPTDKRLFNLLCKKRK